MLFWEYFKKTENQLLCLFYPFQWQKERIMFNYHKKRLQGGCDSVLSLLLVINILIHGHEGKSNIISFTSLDPNQNRETTLIFCLHFFVFFLRFLSDFASEDTNI